jgi:hypothetical protein
MIMKAGAMVLAPRMTEFDFGRAQTKGGVVPIQGNLHCFEWGPDAISPKTGVTRVCQV